MSAVDLDDPLDPPVQDRDRPPVELVQPLEALARGRRGAGQQGQDILRDPHVLPPIAQRLSVRRLEQVRLVRVDHVDETERGSVDLLPGQPPFELGLDPGVHVPDPSTVGVERIPQNALADRENRGHPGHGALERAGELHAPRQYMRFGGLSVARGRVRVRRGAPQPIDLLPPFAPLRNVEAVDELVERTDDRVPREGEGSVSLGAEHLRETAPARIEGQAAFSMAPVLPRVEPREEAGMRRQGPGRHADRPWEPDALAA